MGLIRGLKRSRAKEVEEEIVGGKVMGGGKRKGREMFSPCGHSPDEARIEMSGHILSAREGKGWGGAKIRRQTIRLQGTGPYPISFYLPLLSFLYIAIFPPTPSAFALSIPKAIEYQHLISLLFPQASRRPIECPSPDRRGMEHGADLARSHRFHQRKL